MQEVKVFENTRMAKLSTIPAAKTNFCLVCVSHRSSKRAHRYVMMVDAKINTAYFAFQPI